MIYAPVVLFVYNRPEHTLKTLEALSKNKYADKTTLYIYADGPKEGLTPEEFYKIKETRNVLRKKLWVKDVVIIESDHNKGLAESIVHGVSSIVNKYGKVIVLEDDIITSEGFLKYMNEALNIYDNVEEVFHISAYMHPIKYPLPNLFFYNANSCWGWATWKRAWKFFVDDIKVLNECLLKHPNYNVKSFNKGQGKAFSEQLLGNIDGSLSTWAIKWHASIFLQNGFCLHPGKSLIRNIGFDSSGLHCGTNEVYLKQDIVEGINVKLLPLEESSYVIRCIEESNNPRIASSLLCTWYRAISYFRQIRFCYNRKTS